MTWLKLADEFAKECRRARISDAAFRVHVEALCFAMDDENGGVIYKDDLLSISRVTDPLAAVEELCDSSFWERISESKWQILHSPRQSASTSSTLSNRAPDSITPSCVLLIPPTSATSTCRRCWAARSRRAFLAIVAESVDATPARCPRDGHGAQPAGGMSPVQRAASPRDGSQVCVTGTDGSCILGITPGRFGPGRAAGPDSPPVSGAPGARGSPSRGRRWPTGATE